MAPLDGQRQTPGAKCSHFISNANANNHNKNNSNSYHNNTYLVLSFTKGLNESFINICGKMGVQVHFKGGNTIKKCLVSPKDRENTTQRSTVIYRHKCDRLECDGKYLEESARTFGQRLREHLRTPSPIYDHVNSTGYQTRVDNCSIVSREVHNIIRTIKEAVYIRVNDSSLNRDIGSSSCPTFGMRS